MVTRLQQMNNNTYSKAEPVRQQPRLVGQSRSVFDPRVPIVIRTKKRYNEPRVGAGEPDEESSAEDVIDLGAPRLPRRRPPTPPTPPTPPRRVLRAYTPNPRLYPGPKAQRPRQKRRHRRPPPEERAPRRRPPPEERAPRRRHKRVFQRVVPNSRLYRPAPPRPRASPPPPANPRASWPPPAPVRTLDTASHVAFRLAERRASLPAPAPAPRRPALLTSYTRRPRVQRSPVRQVASVRRFYDDIAAAQEKERERVTLSGARRRAPPPPPGARDAAAAPPAPDARRLVVTLPEGAMAASVSEEPADTTDMTSAPSEYLAEFLSAIMRQQYAEALKYCRLILQYEPHNATARGFYPLLQQKLRLQRECSSSTDAERKEIAAPAGALPSQPSGPSAGARGSGAEARGSGAGAYGHAVPDLDADPQPYPPEEMEQEADVSPASSLYSLGSDESDPEPSLSLSHTDGTDRTDPLRSSSGSPNTSAGSADLNGNCAEPPLVLDDVKNDNAPGDRINFSLNSESSASLSSLQRLRARFACSK